VFSFVLTLFSLIDLIVDFVCCSSNIVIVVILPIQHSLVLLIVVLRFRLLIDSFGCHFWFTFVDSVSIDYVIHFVVRCIVLILLPLR